VTLVQPALRVLHISMVEVQNSVICDDRNSCLILIGRYQLVLNPAKSQRQHAVPQTAAVQLASSMLVSFLNQLTHGRLRNVGNIISSDVITGAVLVSDAVVCSVNINIHVLLQWWVHVLVMLCCLSL